MAYCGTCQVEFSRPSTLRAHITRKHPDKLNILFPRKIPKSESRKAICKECNTKFATWSGYKKHVKNKHADKLAELIINEKRIYNCKHCNETFQTVRQYAFHKRIHKTIEKKCPLCQYEHTSRKTLVTHYRENHSLQIENEIIQFGTLEDFQRWKSEVEEQTFASFVNEWTKKTAESTKINYLCHRSGRFISKGKNLRRLKKQGSNKIGGYCPAKISVTIQQEKCVVQFCKTHVGHKQEVDHLFLSKSQRQQLADKISAEVPLQTILDELKSPYSDFPVEHVNRVKKKDLYNIKSCLKLKGSSVRQQDNNINLIIDSNPNEDESSNFVDSSMSTIDTSTHQNDTIELIIIESIPSEDKSLNVVQSICTDNISMPAHQNGIYQSFHEEKQKILAEFKEIINAVTSWEELDVIQQTIGSMYETTDP